MAMGLLSKWTNAWRKPQTAAPQAASPPPTDGLADLEGAALSSARECLERTDISGARALLEPYAQRSVRSEVLLLLCRTRLGMGELDSAIELVEHGLKLHPGVAPLLDTAATAWEMKGQPARALVYWQRLVLGSAQPEASHCVSWMRCHAMAARGRAAGSDALVARVLGLLDADPGTTPDLRWQYLEWMYTHPASADAAASTLRQSDPTPPGHEDLTATWRSMVDWSQATGCTVHRRVGIETGKREVQLGELRDVTIAPSFQWIPLLDEGRVALDKFVMHRLKTRREVPASPVLLASDQRLELRLPRQRRVVDGPAVLMGGMPQYYHHTVEFLSALAVLDLFGFGTELPLVVNADLAPFQRQQLALLGYPASRLIPIAFDEAVRFRELLVPSRLVRSGQWISPLVPAWHRKRFVGLSSGATGLKLYVSRALAPRRRIVNEVEVVALLESRGFQLVRPEELELSQQIALFARASHVVAAAGAALANMVYMPPPGDVTVLATTYVLQSPGDTYFDALATACGHRFRWLPGTPTGFHGDRLIDADFAIDIDQLGLALDASV